MHVNERPRPRYTSARIRARRLRPHLSLIRGAGSRVDGNRSGDSVHGDSALCMVARCLAHGKARGKLRIAQV